MVSCQELGVGPNFSIQKATDVLYVNHQECKEVSFVEVAVPASSPDVECPFLSTPLLPLPECLNLALLPRWQCYGSSFMRFRID
uniref:Uncharacterized protein n=1 Tax=Oryza punctata TaxID=4537 RepID=A0A0E0K3C5_ORYPU